MGRTDNLTPEERRAVKGALRRAFRQSPRMRQVLNKARRELPPKIKIDGTPGKKNQVRYICASCFDLYPQKHVAVDHKEPVVPLHIKEDAMSMDDLVNGIFCHESNLQVLCSTPIKLLPKGKRSCHALKTAEENFIRSGLEKADLSKSSLEFTILKLRGEYGQYISEKQKLAEEKELRKQLKLQKKKKKEIRNE